MKNKNGHFSPKLSQDMGITSIELIPKINLFSKKRGSENKKIYLNSVYFKPSLEQTLPEIPITKVNNAEIQTINLSKQISKHSLNNVLLNSEISKQKSYSKEKYENNKIVNYRLNKIRERIKNTLKYKNEKIQNSQFLLITEKRSLSLPKISNAELNSDLNKKSILSTILEIKSNMKKPKILINHEIKQPKLRKNVSTKASTKLLLSLLVRDEPNPTGLSIKNNNFSNKLF